MLSTCAALYQAGCYLSGTPINTDSSWYTELKQATTIRETVSADMTETERLAYYTTMGLADYVLADTVTQGYGGEILMALEGYGEIGYQAAGRGLNPDAIQMEGISSGVSDCTV